MTCTWSNNSVKLLSPLLSREILSRWWRFHSLLLYDEDPVLFSEVSRRSSLLSLAFFYFFANRFDSVEFLSFSACRDSFTIREILTISLDQWVCIRWSLSSSIWKARSAHWKVLMSRSRRTFSAGRLFHVCFAISDIFWEKMRKLFR